MKIVITLPFPLPTWNTILAMNQWERKELRDWIHLAVSELSVIDTRATTRTELAVRPSWMVLHGSAYFAMIRPSGSKKSRSRRGSAKQAKKRRYWR